MAVSSFDQGDQNRWLCQWNHETEGWNLPWIPWYRPNLRSQESWPFHSKIHPALLKKSGKYEQTHVIQPIMLIKIDSHEPSPFFEKLWSSPLWWRSLHLGDCIRCWLKKVIRSDGFHSDVFLFFRTFFTPKHGDDARNMGTIQFVDFKQVGSTTN